MNGGDREAGNRDGGARGNGYGSRNETNLDGNRQRGNYPSNQQGAKRQKL